MSEFFIEIVFLTCEYLKEPQGIDNAAPRFAWKYKSNMENGKQTEYKISVWAENGCMWDSGWVLSAKQHNIVYGGKKLQPKTKYFWKVFSKSNLTEEIAESETAAFETGFLNSKWQGSWIGSPDFNNNTPYFKKRFFLKDNVKKARVYICGLGYYELLINGEKVGDSILDPAWTNYDKKALYASYTADRLLNKGE
ncbi:MAG: alpha-L-rhamnosidase N-terminal domain-containing protein, partial [Oscillospiraceae bacterium]